MLVFWPALRRCTVEVAHSTFICHSAERLPGPGGRERRAEGCAAKEEDWTYKGAGTVAESTAEF